MVEYPPGSPQCREQDRKIGTPTYADQDKWIKEFQKQNPTQDGNGEMTILNSVWFPKRQAVEVNTDFFRTDKPTASKNKRENIEKPNELTAGHYKKIVNERFPSFVTDNEGIQVGNK